MIHPASNGNADMTSIALLSFHLFSHEDTANCVSAEPIEGFRVDIYDDTACRVR
jgi:hypothetical protein